MTKEGFGLHMIRAESREGIEGRMMMDMQVWMGRFTHLRIRGRCWPCRFASSWRFLFSLLRGPVYSRQGDETNHMSKLPTVACVRCEGP